MSLAENLCAAYVAHQMGLTSLDYTRKRYVLGRGEVGEFWKLLAKDVEILLTQSIADRMLERERVVDRIAEGTIEEAVARTKLEGIRADLKVLEFPRKEGK